MTGKTNPPSKPAPAKTSTEKSPTQPAPGADVTGQPGDGIPDTDAAGAPITAPAE